MSDGQIQAKPARFIAELQSLRGLAALTVMIHHCSFYYIYAPGPKKWAEVLFNAHAAVVVFYVLSGFVLYESLKASTITANAALRFYVRRLFRIYPALWLACALGVTYVALFQGHPFPPSVSPWFSASFRMAPTASKLLMAFLGSSHAIPVPLWSIVVELVASAFMPLILIASRRWTSFAALGATFLVLSFAGGMNMPMNIGGYLIQFIFGAWLARWAVPVMRQSHASRWAATIGCAALLGLDFVRQAGGWDYASHYHNPVAALLEGVFATALVGAIAAWPQRFALLRWRWLLGLGDISYSLYLIHLPILALVAGIGGEWLGLPGLSSGGLTAMFCLMAIVMPLSIGLSALSYRYIEKPGIDLGKKALGRIAMAR